MDGSKGVAGLVATKSPVESIEGSALEGSETYAKTCQSLRVRATTFAPDARCRPRLEIHN